MLFKNLINCKTSVLKYVLVGVAFLGLLGWNASLEKRLAKGGEDEGESRHPRSVSGSVDRPSFGPTGGAMFVRWGRRDCPNSASELVYSGIVGASNHLETGGSAEYACLTREPQYAKYTAGLEGWAKIMGVEFQVSGTNFFDKSRAAGGNLHDADVVCAVCRSKARASQVMIPGRKECYPGWNMEYWGYLMTAHYGHKAQHNWACVDNAPEGDEKGARNDNGGLMYHVQGVCGSLPCPKYVNGRELTCVVCTK